MDSSLSKESRIIILDSNYLSLSFKEVEEKLDLDFNESDILDFIFNSFKYKNTALEELDYNLLNLYKEIFPIYPSLQNSTETILKTIRDVGLFLFNELLSYNCYRKNTLIYYPKLDIYNNRLMSYQINLSPLILIPINNKDLL